MRIRINNPGDRCLSIIIPSINIIPLYLFIFLHFTVSIAGYTPTENFAISCGDSGDLSPRSGRDWTGDIGSIFSPSSEKNEPSTTFSASEQPTNTTDQLPVPYSTARLSRYEFKYSFPATLGQKYIRLHFYPTSYGEFDRSKAFFTVRTSDGYNLLSNFSAADYLGQEEEEIFIVREFCVINFNGDEDGNLSITFIPTGAADTYAFINGIEVVSMPDYLYFTSPQAGGFNFIGQQNSLSVKTDYFLELAYRLNVGGKSLSPIEDTGMFRTWEADNDYFVNKVKLAFVHASTTADLNFTEIPSYTAPVEVYRTARSMGNNNTENADYGLSWVLPVDSDFSYVVRLHFCEFRPEIQMQQDREFTILIANQTAEEHADVITWSGGNGVPIYKDYGIMVQNVEWQQVSNEKQNLYIQLHSTSPYSGNRTIYSDAILNGIELFKLRNRFDGDDELLLGLDTPSTTTVEPSTTSTRSGSKRIKLVAITGGVVSGLVAVVVLVSILYYFLVGNQKKRKSCPAGLRDGAKSTDNHPSSLPSNLCRHFSLQDIKTATKNFNKGYILGKGGFGTVYKGYININGGSGTTTVGVAVAIKRLNPDSQQGAHEFTTEIEMLSQLRYIHLVSLVGYCYHKREMILAYEYMANGNLRDHLYNSTTDNPPLPWTLRLQICIGAARGIHYLHAGVKKPIIHRDVKTSNILLDHKWVAKVSDFGLSKMSPTSVANAHISTVVKGSFGYLDPEYFRFQRLNEKSDVYSFGVVLFEVLCARPPVAVNQTQTGKEEEEEEQAGLAYRAVSSYKDGKLEEIIDPHLKGEITPLCLEKYAELAVSCVLDQRINRPSMTDVVKGLELALELQEEAEKGIITTRSESSLDEDDHDEEILSQSSVSVKMEVDACTF